MIFIMSFFYRPEWIGVVSILCGVNKKLEIYQAYTEKAELFSRLTPIFPL